MAPASLPMHKQALTVNCSVLSCLRLSTPMMWLLPLLEEMILSSWGFFGFCFGFVLGGGGCLFSWFFIGFFLKVHSYISLQVPLEFIH